MKLNGRDLAGNRGGAQKTPSLALAEEGAGPGSNRYALLGGRSKGRGVIVLVNRGGISLGTGAKDVGSIRAVENAPVKCSLTNLLLAWHLLKAAILPNALRCAFTISIMGGYAKSPPLRVRLFQEGSSANYTDTLPREAASDALEGRMAVALV
jgi:hypothetical protein